jgi:transcriptional regulator with XRE-family HTH domain
MLEVTIPDMTPGMRIAALRKERELSGRALAKMAGVSQGLISQIETGYVTTLSAENMAAIARVLGTSTEYLLHGGRTKPNRGPTFAYAWDRSNQGRDLSWVQFYLIPSIRLRELGNLKNNPKTEHGEFVNPGKTAAVSADTARALTLTPGRLLAIDADGDSMAPRIAEGDTLIVDLNDIDLVDGKIYAVVASGQPRVSRVFCLPSGRTLLRPDNPSHPPLELDADQLRVVGRVALIQSAA